MVQISGKLEDAFNILTACYGLGLDLQNLTRSLLEFEWLFPISFKPFMRYCSNISDDLKTAKIKQCA